MKVVNIGSLEPKVLPKHNNVYSRRIWGHESGGINCAVGYYYITTSMESINFRR